MTAPAYNPQTARGGVLVLLVKEDLTVSTGGKIQMDGKGFPSGVGGVGGNGGVGGVGGGTATQGGLTGIGGHGMFGGGHGGAEGDLGSMGTNGVIPGFPGSGVIASNVSVLSTHFALGAGGMGGSGKSGGNGAGGGGGSSNPQGAGLSGISGNAGGNGGDGGGGGRGGGVIFLRVNNVVLPNTGQVFYSRGLDGMTGTNATSGGTGGNGGHALVFDECLSLGGPGGGGNGGDGGNGGNGGSGGAGGSVKIYRYTINRNVDNTLVNVSGGLGGIGGFGGSGGAGGLNGALAPVVIPATATCLNNGGGSGSGIGGSGLPVLNCALDYALDLISVYGNTSSGSGVYTLNTNMGSCQIINDTLFCLLHTNSIISDTLLVAPYTTCNSVFSMISFLDNLSGAFGSVGYQDPLIGGASQNQDFFDACYLACPSQSGNDGVNGDNGIDGSVGVFEDESGCIPEPEIIESYSDVCCYEFDQLPNGAVGLININSYVSTTYYTHSTWSSESETESYGFPDQNYCFEEIFEVTQANNIVTINSTYSSFIDTIYDATCSDSSDVVVFSLMPFTDFKYCVFADYYLDGVLFYSPDLYINDIDFNLEQDFLNQGSITVYNLSPGDHVIYVEVGSGEFCYSTAQYIFHVDPYIFDTSDVFISGCEEVSVVNGQSFTSSGTYLVDFIDDNGCNETIRYHLTIYDSTYTVTNVTSCGSLWIEGIEYSVSGQYILNLTSIHGCDSIVELNLTILANSYTAINQSICEGDYYSFNSMNLTMSGVYYDTLNAVNGCDSIVTLSLNVLNNSNTILIEEICFGESYSFNGITYHSSGQFFDTLQNVNGCDSIVVLNLSVKEQAIEIMPIVICANDVYEFNGNYYNTSGIYFDTLQTSEGCDSILRLELTVLEPILTTLDVGICIGDSYYFNGQSYSASGLYTVGLISSQGCDSIVTLQLIVDNQIVNNISEVLCNGEFLYFNDQFISSAGQYTDTLISSFGCDSIVFLDVNISYPVTTELSEQICFGESYYFNGQLYSTSGVYSVFLQTVYGCDSIVILNLSINPTDTVFIFENLCFGSTYSFNGQLISGSGDYVAVKQNIFGCDSVIHLNLTVLDEISSSLNETICFGDSFVFGGISYNTSGQYVNLLVASNGCDSLVILNLLVLNENNSQVNVSICEGTSYLFNEQSLVSSGIYYDTLVSSMGCDSIVQLNLNVNQKDTVEFNLVGCEVVSLNGVVYTQSGVYTQLLTNQNGCDSILKLYVLVHSSLVSDTSILLCEGDQVEIDNVAYQSDTTFNVSYVSSLGCDSIVQYTLSFEIISIELNQSNDTFVCEGENLLLEVINSSYNVIWNTGETTNSILVTQTGFYLVEFENAPCLVSDSVRINFVSCNKDMVFIDAFTPNGDLNNDIFLPLFNRSMEKASYEFSVYNRWGEKVFFTNSDLIGWDGKYNGEFQPIGTYYYTLRFVDAKTGIEYNYNGTVDLLR